MLQKDLQKLGFTKNLSTVYLTLFELGEAKAGEIVRRTGMHRNLVYTALETLEDKKLISKSKARGVALYRVLDPTRIMGEVDEKKKLAEQIIEELQSKHTVTSQEVVIYEGKEEMQKKYLELFNSLREGDLWYVLGLSNGFHDINSGQIKELENIHKRSKATIRGVGSYINDSEQRYEANTKGLTEFKRVPAMLKNDVDVQILHGSLYMFIYTKPYTVIEIRNKDFVDNYIEYFHILWNSNTLTLSGEEGTKAFLEDTLQCSDVYFIGGNGGMERYYPEVWDWYKKKRIEKEVTWHDLIDPGMSLSGAKEGTLIYDDPYYEWKFLPTTVASPHVICIYEDKVANIVWKENSIINVIKDQEIAEGYKKYHKYLWQQEVHTYTGWEEIERLFFEYLLPAQKKGDTEYNAGAGYGEEGEDDRVLDFYLRYNATRTRRGIHKKLTFSEKHRAKSIKEMKDSGDNDLEFVEMRYLPDEYYTPMQTHITAGKAVVVLWSDVPVATVYENPKIVASFIKQFELQWDLGKE